MYSTICSSPLQLQSRHYPVYCGKTHQNRCFAWQEWPGPWTIVTVKHGRSSASLAASPLSPDNGVREYSSGVGRSAAEQRNVKVGREPWYACARSAGDCFIRCRSRASMRMAGLWLYKSSPVLYAQSMKRCGPVLRVYIFCFVCFYAYHLK